MLHVVVHLSHVLVSTLFIFGFYKSMICTLLSEVSWAWKTTLSELKSVLYTAHVNQIDNSLFIFRTTQASGKWEALWKMVTTRCILLRRSVLCWWWEHDWKSAGEPSEWLSSHVRSRSPRGPYTRGENTQGAFLWDDLDQDHRSKITWIMEHQKFL